jgi:hypothetical protein
MNGRTNLVESVIEMAVIFRIHLTGRCGMLVERIVCTFVIVRFRFVEATLLAWFVGIENETFMVGSQRCLTSFTVATTQFTTIYHRTVISFTARRTFVDVLLILLP